MTESSKADDGAGGSPPDDVDVPEVEDGGSRLNWPTALLLMFLAAFVAGIGVYWWQQRPPQPSRTDVGFYSDMTSHHMQAIAMANTYIKNGTDPLLLHVAREISFDQSGDIRHMQDALVDWDEEGDDQVAMDWMGMSVPEDQQPGMATDAQIRELQAARGDKLDELFTELMIHHHAGGIHMADYAGAKARLGEVRSTAAAIAAGQASEIAEMNLWRTQHGMGAVPAGT